jgi:hypothetical protein
MRFSGVDMPIQPSTQLQHLVQHDRCNNPPPKASIGPAAVSSIDDPDNPSDNTNNPEAIQTEEDGVYHELDWAHVPQLKRCGKEHLKGPLSWI